MLAISLGGLTVFTGIFIVFAMVGMKLEPSYLEFSSIKNAVNAIAQEKPNASVAEVRKLFDARATVDAITTITGKDVEVTKDGGALLIAVSYRKEIPLAGNLGVYIDFHAASKD